MITSRDTQMIVIKKDNVFFKARFLTPSKKWFKKTYLEEFNILFLNNRSYKWNIQYNNKWLKLQLPSIFQHQIESTYVKHNSNEYFTVAISSFTHFSEYRIIMMPRMFIYTLIYIFIIKLRFSHNKSIDNFNNCNAMLHVTIVLHVLPPREGVHCTYNSTLKCIVL